jgi:hypothetical protein
LIASRIIFRDRNFDEEDDGDEDLEAENDDMPDHQPLTDEEMEAELDQAEADEAQIDKS